jgi:biopolymer transport protein ExbD
MVLMKSPEEFPGEMITRPLDLESHLSRPPRDLDTVHWVSVAGAALFFLLAGSRFVLAPGLLVAADGPEFAIMRHAGGVQNVPTAPEVVSYKRDNFILFRGTVYKRVDDLRQPLAAYGAGHRGAVLPVLADQQVSMQAITALAELAKNAGFGSILLLGETDKPAGQEPLD